MGTKKLAWIQIILVAVSTLCAILFATQKGDGSGFFAYTDNTWGIIFLCVAIASIVVAIMQIVDHGSGVALAAGICGLLSFIPFVGLAALILNIIVVASK